MINVTKPFLPPREEYNKYLDGIWERGWLTNNGPLLNELEQKLKDYLHVSNVLFLSNGTIALQLAIKALHLQGEIITTPFSYVATSSSIVWENCSPVFVDIDPLTLNIDPKKIEAAINPKTTAIIATHVYGNACDIDAIQLIADKHNLKVIYDAAHAFGSTYKGKSLYEYGDISTASFHATKLFHSIEGGAVFTKDKNILETLSYMRNFGHNSATSFAGLGINGKNSEFHAAMGLVNLNHIADICSKRIAQSDYYDKLFAPYQSIKKPVNHKDAISNKSYYPIIFESETLLLTVVEALNAHWIYPRRYFYPALTNLPYVSPQNTPIAEDIAKRVLCLPMYHTLSTQEIDLIHKLIVKNI